MLALLLLNILDLTHVAQSHGIAAITVHWNEWNPLFVFQGISQTGSNKGCDTIIL